MDMVTVPLMVTVMQATSVQKVCKSYVLPPPILSRCWPLTILTHVLPLDCGHFWWVGEAEGREAHKSGFQVKYLTLFNLRFHLDIFIEVLTNTLYQNNFFDLIMTKKHTYKLQKEWHKLHLHISTNHILVTSLSMSVESFSMICALHTIKVLINIAHSNFFYFRLFSSWVF